MARWKVPSSFPDNRLSLPMNKTIAVVLAAGKGTRMQSDLPKVLIEVCGRPMIDYVLDALNAAGVDEVLVVVGYRGDLVRQALASRPRVRFVEQTEQLGTGHAVMACREALAGQDGAVLIVTGDSPLAQSDSLRTLLAEFERARPACLMGTTHKDDPHGLGRIVRDPQGRFERIVEEKDADESQRRITEVNMSCYVFAGPDLLFALDHIRPNNSQAEYYLTDCPGVLKAAGRTVSAMPVLKPIEALSINTREELAAVEGVLRAGGRPADN
ncbi:MAG TPA: NTP transferase domain-containing protein [Pirellulales bacterium]|nr:NTP transferase domain-containing protein [Pirellulales bacterium]